MPEETVIIISPAKRLLALYFLAYSVAMLLLVIGLEHLRQSLGLTQSIIGLVWKIAIIAGIGHLCFIFLRHLTSIFTISGEYVAATVGILAKDHIRIPLNKIVDYRVVTSLLQRILGLGTIFVNTAGNEELLMPNVSKDEIDSAVLRLDELLNEEQHRPELVVNSVR